SRLEPVSSHSTPQSSGAPTPDSHSIIDTVSEQDEGTMTPPSKETTPTTSPRNSVRSSVDTIKRTPEPRTVNIKKFQAELGIQIGGGNMHGIFVSDLEEESPAKGSEGLMPGDLILEVTLLIILTELLPDDIITCAISLVARHLHTAHNLI
ncbi:hypothetical protein L345_17556, partial [Ophiophagus hannah]